MKHSGSITARHYATREMMTLTWRDGMITEIRPAAAQLSEDLWFAPGLVDLQINGFGGVDFQQDGLTEGELLKASRALRTAGCTRFLLTLVTDRWESLLTRVAHLRRLRSESSELSSGIAGWHIEGPFLSSEPGYCGAHDPSLMCDPTPDLIRQLRSVTGNDPVLVTIAPERIGAYEAIAEAAKLGMRVSLGHTNAGAACISRALAAGAKGFTHLGNACPQALDRHDNILWRVLDTSCLLVSLIPDGIHVSPSLFRLIHRAIPVESIYYTTDAMSAAGVGPGRYQLGKLELEVGDDGVVRHPGRTNFAGSALKPSDGVIRAAEMLNSSWLKVWDGFSSRPAKWMGILNQIEVGGEATFCVVHPCQGSLSCDVSVIWQGKQWRQPSQTPTGLAHGRLN